MPVDPYLGDVSIFAGNFAPRGWAFCDGTLLPISSNSALFSILGTIYGGDGRTTFALPDLRGRAPIGPRHGPGLRDYKLGAKGGQELHTLTISEIPAHSHAATATSKLYGQNSPGDDDTLGAGASIASGSTSGSEIFSSEAPNTEMNTSSVQTSTIILNQGGNLSHNNMQPYIAVNYIIALVGIYPSRS